MCRTCTTGRPAVRHARSNSEVRCSRNGLLRRPQRGSSKPRWRSTISRVVAGGSSESMAPPYGRAARAPKRRCCLSAMPMIRSCAVKTELELRHLRVFAAVVDAGTHTRAARALGISQSTVSETLQRAGAHAGRRAVSQGGQGRAGADAVGRGPARLRAPHVRTEQRARRGARRRVDPRQGHAGGLGRRVDRRLRAPVATGRPSRALAGGARGGAHRQLRRDPRACRRGRERPRPGARAGAGPEAGAILAKARLLILGAPTHPLARGVAAGGRAAPLRLLHVRRGRELPSGAAAALRGGRGSGSADAGDGHHRGCEARDPGGRDGARPLAGARRRAGAAGRRARRGARAVRRCPASCCEPCSRRARWAHRWSTT